MSGLLLKDFLNSRKYLKTMLLFTAFYTIFAFSFDDSSVINIMLILLFMMVPISSFSFDEMAKWDKYALAMPITRKDMVLSKYIFAFSFIVIGIIISISFSVVFALFKDINVLEQLKFNYVFFVGACIIISVLFPLIYKFGVEKSRLFLMAILAVPSLLLIAANRLGLPIPSEGQLHVLLMFSPLLLVGIILASFFLSVRIYKNKEL